MERSLLKGLDIKGAKLPVACAGPVFSSIDDDVTDRILDIIIELYIIGMPASEIGLDQAIGGTSNWMAA
ncbi:hypothetical protein KDA_70460 [Dictyobacter alpinus]|uniref:Uncharacterized protein n=1 Tax=Dictyobacter alpinus TaxID=2014873 RepID=A0A402BJN3_9CHLR|nr:hypothetical protein KDA_70460 [Dictyobacter alpinus]